MSVFSSMATIQGNSPKRVLVLVLTPMMRVEVAVTPSGFTTPQPGYIELKNTLSPFLDANVKIQYNHSKSQKSSLKIIFFLCPSKQFLPISLAVGICIFPKNRRNKDKAARLYCTDKLVTMHLPHKFRSLKILGTLATLNSINS